jgi:hypothetical protein
LLGFMVGCGGAELAGFFSPVLFFVIPAGMLLILALIWPSYRIAALGSLVFWATPFFVIHALLVGYYGFELIKERLPMLFTVTALSVLWAMLCVTIARLRLPTVYPPGHCQACGYDLRGLEQNHPRCPECGESIVMPKRYPHD